MNKNVALKNSIQTSFNFAHEEHEGSLELSTVASTILEEDILLWKTSQSATISALHGVPPFCHQTDGNLGMRQSINLDTSLSRFSMFETRNFVINYPYLYISLTIMLRRWYP